MDAIEQVEKLAGEIISNAEETKLLIAKYRADRALDDAEVKTDELIARAREAQRLLAEFRSHGGQTNG